MYVAQLLKAAGILPLQAFDLSGEVICGKGIVISPVLC